VIRRIILTASTAAWLSGLFLLYAMIVSPRVEPRLLQAPAAVTAGMTMEAAGRPLENMRLAQLYLTQQPWARNANYQLRLGDMFIFTQMWEKQPQSAEIRFTPFAMIRVRANGAPDEEPVTIVSDAATVRFASEFDMANPQPGRIVGGTLEGSVRIRGARNLQIEGRTFDFAEEALRLWSANPVEFVYGTHSGSGRGLQIDFLPLDGPPDRDKPAVSGILSLTVLQRVDVRIDPEAMSKRLRKIEAGEPASTDTAQFVQVKSDGRFQFLPNSNLMTFENNVRVIRPTGPETYDALTAPLLSLLFREPLPLEGAPERAVDPNKPLTWVPTSLEFYQLRAQGNEKKGVVLVSQRHEFRAETHELIYDGPQQRITLRDPQEVRVFQQEHEVHSREIQLVHNDEGELVTLDCQGPGWLKSPNKEHGTVTAGWKEGLKKFLDPQTQLDVVELKGRAGLRLKEDTALDAEQIRFWISGGEALFDSGAPSVQPEQSGGLPDDVQIERILASGDVIITSPQLRGRMKQLGINFQTEASSPLLTATRKQKSGDLQTARFLTPGDEAQHTGALTNFESSGEDSGLGKLLGGSSAAGSEDPIDITADAVIVQIVRAADQPTEMAVAEIRSQGAVTVLRTSSGTREPFLEGEWLRMQNLGPDDQVVHLRGEPAHVRDRGMHLEGKSVHLNLRENLAWVDGPGLLQMPVKSALDGKPLETPQLLDVWWKERMQFDGLTAEFFESVRAGVNESTMRCHTMKVVLSERIIFADAQRKKPHDQIDLKSVSCHDGVDIEDYQYEQNKLVSVHKGRVWQFQVDKTTGRTQAQGPGSILVWRRGQANRAGLAPTSTVKANRSSHRPSTEWEYLRIDFAGQMKGNINERFTTFNDQVEIVYGPVKRSTDTVNPDAPPPYGGWMRCDTLQFTHHAATPKKGAYIQMLAAGNAELSGTLGSPDAKTTAGRNPSEVNLEGGTFHARAESISYDESKGVYRLRSLGAQKASIWRQAAPGARASHFEAQQIEFNPANSEIKALSTTGLEGFQ